MDGKIKLRPELDGQFWMIGDNPDLGALQGNRDPSKGWPQECVDHHIFKASDGQWHLWGCIRGTAVGRVLYHWQSACLTDEHWRQTGEMIRPDPTAGEDVCHVGGQQWIQSPYVVQENGLYYMFYGGHSTEWDAYGRMRDDPNEARQMVSARARGQICLMTSADGLHWERRRDTRGQTRLFMGPGETRDPMLLKIRGVWHMYMAGAVVRHDGAIIPQVYLRTSDDLVHWSDYIPVHSDTSANDPNEADKGVWSHECPFVAERGGYFYLLRTENYAKALTHVYRSEDPADFGLCGSDARAKYVGTLGVAAPEIIMDEHGGEFITSNHNLQGGTMLCRLRWVEDA